MDALLVPSDVDSNPRTLPGEIIVEFLQYSRRSALPALALVSRAFQGQAERLLYRKIQLVGSSKIMSDSYIVRGCLYTLMNSTRKVLLVQSFAFSFTSRYRRLQESTLQDLAECLPAMTSLKHLWLQFPSKQPESAELINPVLRQVGIRIYVCFLDHCKTMTLVFLLQELYFFSHHSPHFGIP
jgi:hypothetical protein